jgi:hypothetical protein
LFVGSTPGNHTKFHSPSSTRRISAQVRAVVAQSHLVPSPSRRAWCCWGPGRWACWSARRGGGRGAAPDAERAASKPPAPGNPCRERIAALYWLRGWFLDSRTRIII